jgi:hypothetical protein
MIVGLKYSCIKVIATEKVNMSSTQSSDSDIVDMNINENVDINCDVTDNVIVNVDVEESINITPPKTIPTYYNDDCAICYESISSIIANGGSIVTFECNHQLCNTCTFEYAKTVLVSGSDITCPICRHVLLPCVSAKYQQLRRTYMPRQEVHTTIALGPRPTVIHSRERYILPYDRRMYRHRCYCVLFVMTVAMLVVLLILHQSGIFQQS